MHKHTRNKYFLEHARSQHRRGSTVQIVKDHEHFSTHPYMHRRVLQQRDHC
jgi:hypothetical protein